MAGAARASRTGQRADHPAAVRGRTAAHGVRGRVAHVGGPTTSADAFRAAARKSTLPGVTKLGETMTERATTWQGRDAINVGLPHKYRVDYIDGGTQARKVRSEVCDGRERWRQFADHVSVGAALPPPDAVARLADPAWLLE